MKRLRGNIDRQQKTPFGCARPTPRRIENAPAPSRSRGFPHFQDNPIRQKKTRQHPLLRWIFRIRSQFPCAKRPANPQVLHLMSRSVSLSADRNPSPTCGGTQVMAFICASPSLPLRSYFRKRVNLRGVIRHVCIRLKEEGILLHRIAMSSSSSQAMPAVDWAVATWKARFAPDSLSRRFLPSGRWIFPKLHPAPEITHLSCRLCSLRPHVQ